MIDQDELELCKSCKLPAEQLDSEKHCRKCGVLTLSVDAIRDFQVCELYYKYKYEEERHIPIRSRDLMIEKFENTLKKVASFFFYKKQAGTVPSYTAILNRWEKLWFPKNMTAYDMAVQQHEAAHANLASYSNAAAASLERFHNEFADSQAVPIMIDEPYVVPIRNDLRIEGSLDLVLRYEDEYHIFKWVDKNKRKVDSLMLDIGAMRLAFEYRNEFPRRATYWCYDLSTSNNPYFDIEQPTKADMNALIYWARGIADADVFVPRRSFTTYCKTCPFDKPCAEFSEWPEAVR